MRRIKNRSIKFKAKRAAMGEKSKPALINPYLKNKSLNGPRTGSVDKYNNLYSWWPLFIGNHDDIIRANSMSLYTWNNIVIIWMSEYADIFYNNIKLIKIITSKTLTTLSLFKSDPAKSPSERDKI